MYQLRKNSLLAYVRIIIIIIIIIIIYFYFIFFEFWLVGVLVQ